MVFGHHALYTKGVDHSIEARSLRLPAAAYDEGGAAERWRMGRGGAWRAPRRHGFGLERVLVEGGAAAYFAGHEHVMQVRGGKARVQCRGFPCATSSLPM